jgi:hypothetical protein
METTRQSTLLSTVRIAKIGLLDLRYIPAFHAVRRSVNKVTGGIHRFSSMQPRLHAQRCQFADGKLQAIPLHKTEQRAELARQTDQSLDG